MLWETNMNQKEGDVYEFSNRNEEVGSLFSPWFEHALA